MGCTPLFSQNIEAPIELVDLNDHLVLFESFFVVFFKDGPIEFGNLKVNGLKALFLIETNGVNVTVFTNLSFLILKFFGGVSVGMEVDFRIELTKVDALLLSD